MNTFEKRNQAFRILLTKSQSKLAAIIAKMDAAEVEKRAS
jgi:hypothetical protein